MAQAISRRELLLQRLTAEQQHYFAQHNVRAHQSVCVLGSLPVIHNVGTGSIEIGEHTVLNSLDESSFVPLRAAVKFSVGYNAHIRIGKHSQLNGAAISSYQQVSIGNRVQIGPGGFITDTDLHPLQPAERAKQIMGKPYNQDLVQRKPVTIEDDVWIGMNVIILKGVHIGRGATIAAGSIVTKNVEAFSIVAGNPARVCATCTEQEQRDLDIVLEELCA